MSVGRLELISHFSLILHMFVHMCILSLANKQKVWFFWAVIVSQGGVRLGTSALQLQSDWGPRKPMSLCITASSWSQLAHPTLLFGPASCSKAKKTCVSLTAGSCRHLRHAGGCRCYCPCLSALTARVGNRMLAHTLLATLASGCNHWGQKTACRKGLDCEL